MKYNAHSFSQLIMHYSLLWVVIDKICMTLELAWLVYKWWRHDRHICKKLAWGCLCFLLETTPSTRKIQVSNLKRRLRREAVWGYSHPERESGWYFHNTLSTSVFQLGKWPREGLLFTSVWGIQILNIAMMMLAIFIHWELQLFSTAYTDFQCLKKHRTIQWS